MILKAFAPKRRCVITLTDVDGKRARTEAHLARRGGFSLGKKRLVAWNRKDCSGLLAVVGREVVWRFPRRMGGEGTTALRLRGSEGPEVGGRGGGGGASFSDRPASADAPWEGPLREELVLSSSPLVRREQPERSAPEPRRPACPGSAEPSAAR